MRTDSSELPTFIFNRFFIEEFVASHSPCGALGIIEVLNRKYALLAIHLETAIPSHLTEDDFNLGFTLLGNTNFEVINFEFEFYDFMTFNILLNPSNPIVPLVLQPMIEIGNYFVCILDKSSGGAIFFQRRMGKVIVTNLINNWKRIQQSSTTDDQYLQVLIHSVQNLNPKRKMLKWVCSENIDYLNLTQNRLEWKFP